MRGKGNILGACLITSGLLAIASVHWSCAPGEAACVEPLDPEKESFGKSRAEWNAEWWRWYYEASYERHPVLDETGEHCQENQPGGDVFFLAGTFGGSEVTRSCTIPAGVHVWVPLVTFASDNGGVADPAPDDENRAAAEETADTVRSEDLNLEIDGCAVGDIIQYRTGISTFSYDCPVGDCIYEHWGSSFSGHVEPAYSDGYGVLLPPFSAGEHTIHFRGGTAWGTDEADDDFTVEVTYNLTVE